MSEAAFTSLATRLGRLEKDLTGEERTAIREASGGLSPRRMAHQLLDAIDPDLVYEEALGAAQEEGLAEPTEKQLAHVRAQRMEAAAAIFNNPDLRQRLTSVQHRTEQIIHVSVKDELIGAGYSTEDAERARQAVDAFREFVEENRNEITALQLIFSRPYRAQTLTLRHIEELHERIAQPPDIWTTESLWAAYARLERDKVRGVRAERVLTDLVSLVRHAVQMDDELVPYPELVRQRYEAWLADQGAAGRAFTEEQRWWLDRIAGAIGLNLSVGLDDFQYGELRDRGGLFAAQRVFDDQLAVLMTDLNTQLAA